jgi:hypothetical protein
MFFWGNHNILIQEGKGEGKRGKKGEGKKNR